MKAAPQMPLDRIYVHAEPDARPDNGSRLSTRFALKSAFIIDVMEDFFAARTEVFRLPPRPRRCRRCVHLAAPASHGIRRRRRPVLRPSCNAANRSRPRPGRPSCRCPGPVHPDRPDGREPLPTGLSGILRDVAPHRRISLPAPADRALRQTTPCPVPGCRPRQIRRNRERRGKSPRCVDTRLQPTRFQRFCVQRTGSRRTRPVAPDPDLFPSPVFASSAIGRLKTGRSPTHKLARRLSRQTGNPTLLNRQPVRSAQTSQPRNQTAHPLRV